MTSTRRQVRRDTATDLMTATPAEGEMGYDKTNKRFVAGDGATAGGIPHANFKDVQNGSFTAAVAGGTANDLTISTAKNPSTMTDLQGVKVKASDTNTGVMTLKWGSLPAYPIKKYIGSSKVDVAAGDIQDDRIYHFDFDGTDWVLFSSGGAAIPSGTVADYAGISAPIGWLMCYGQDVSRTTYAELFTAIGTSFGAGNGSTTFTLPDLRGRVIAGKDDMGGTSANRLTGTTGSLNGDVLGAYGGAEAVTNTTADMPNHAHNPRYNAGGAGTNTSGINISSGNNSTISNATPTTSSVGGGGAHNNVQPTIILNKIIKT